MKKQEILDGILALNEMISDSKIMLNKLRHLDDEDDEHTVLGVDHVLLDKRSIMRIKAIATDSIIKNINDWASELKTLKQAFRPMSSAEYAKTSYAVCPRCESSCIGKDSLQECGGDFIQRFCSCGSCGEQWEERWAFDLIQSNEMCF